MELIGWDAVNDMRRNNNSRYRYIDVICRMENDKLLACTEIGYTEDEKDTQWYFWSCGLNDNKWEKLK
jgi:hypothetical protein